MDIADVRGYALSSPIEPVQERQFHGGVRRLHKRDVVLVVVETADGQRGVAPAGASSSAMREYFEGDSQSTFADVIEGSVADALEGESVHDPAEAHEHVDALDLPAKLRHEAVSAIDVALWDIRGRELGAPVATLLAEQNDTETTTDLPLYASAGMYMEPEGYADQAAIIDDLGFEGYKYRPGIGPEADRHTVELLAERVDCPVMVDAHTWWKTEGGYDDATVRDLVSHAGEHGVFWVEEPVAPDDYDGYRALAEHAPLAGGESEESPDGLVALGETGAVSFLQGDVRHHRGFEGCWAAAEFCRGRELQYVPHNFGTWLGLVANAHLVAAAPECELLEYPVFEGDPALDSESDPGMYPFELAFDVIEERPLVRDGALSLPSGPGLGVTVDLDVVERYPFVEGPWTSFEYDG
jgi:L-alanine-DL-glutamate epimerase-like enolase superfamily enzyme